MAFVVMRKKQSSTSYTHGAGNIDGILDAEMALTKEQYSPHTDASAN